MSHLYLYFQNFLTIRFLYKLKKVCVLHTSAVICYTINQSTVCCLFSWHYNPLWLYFHSPVVDFSLHILEVTWSHTTTRQSVGLLWTSDQSVAETSDNTQHSQQTNTHAPGGIRNHNLSRRAAEDLHLRPRGHWDRQPVNSSCHKQRMGILFLEFF